MEKNSKNKVSCSFGHVPTPDQLELLEIENVQIILAGGAASGGKSFACVFFVEKYLRPDWHARIFRYLAKDLKGESSLLNIIHNYFGGGQWKTICVYKEKFKGCSIEEIEQAIEKARAKGLKHKSEDYPIQTMYMVKTKLNKSDYTLTFSLQYFVDCGNRRKEYISVGDWETVQLNSLQDDVIYFTESGFGAGWYFKRNTKSAVLKIKHTEDAPIGKQRKIYTAAIEAMHLNDRYEDDNKKGAGTETCFMYVEEVQEITREMIQGTILRRLRTPTKYAKMCKKQPIAQVVFTCNPAPSDFPYNTIKPLLDASKNYKPNPELCKDTWFMYTVNEQFVLKHPSEYGYTQTDDLVKAAAERGCFTFRFKPFTAVKNPHVAGYIETLFAGQPKAVVEQLVLGHWPPNEADVVFKKDRFASYNYDNMYEELLYNSDVYIITGDFAHGEKKGSDRTVLTFWALNFKHDLKKLFTLSFLDMIIMPSNLQQDVTDLALEFIYKYEKQLEQPLIIDDYILESSGFLLLEKTSTGISLYQNALEKFGDKIKVMPFSPSIREGKLKRAYMARNYIEFVSLPYFVNETFHNADLKKMTESFFEEVCAFKDGKDRARDDITDNLMFAIELANQIYRSSRHAIIDYQQRLKKTLKV